MPKITDLAEPASPEEIIAVLYNGAEKAHEAASELEAAWQDKGAGNPWTIVAEELERAAVRIQSKLAMPR